jgi:hypothetical protein
VTLVQTPGSEVSVGLQGWDAVLLLLGIGGLVAAMLWPLIRAFARRVEGGSLNAQLLSEVDQLRERVREVEQVPFRMTELEDRMDFTERLVARSREPDQLQG